MRTGSQQHVDPPMSDPTATAYYHIGSVWMEGSIHCASSYCMVERRVDTGEIRVFPGPYLPRDLDDPDLAPLTLCAPFGSVKVSEYFGRDAAWHGQTLIPATRVTLGTCGTGAKRPISDAGHLRGSMGATLRGGWASWIDRGCSKRPTLMAFNLHRNLRYRWPALTRVKSGACMTRIYTTRYGAIITTHAYTEENDSLPDEYDRVWLVPFPS